MREAFVCTVCKNERYPGRRVPPRDQFAERLEYRSLDTREHLYYRTLRLLCRLCVLDLKAGREPEQGSLDLA